MEKISNKEEYLESISNRDLKIYLMGELVEDPLTHPIIKPSIEAMAETYELAVREPDLASVKSPYTGETINRNQFNDYGQNHFHHIRQPWNIVSFQPTVISI